VEWRERGKEGGGGEGGIRKGEKKRVEERSVRKPSCQGKVRRVCRR